MIRYLLPLLALTIAIPAAAQDRETPYWASIKAEVAYMRVGPSDNYPIDWVYKRKGLPVKVLRLRQGWRLVVDPDGAQGWIYNSLLSAVRGALVTGEGLAEMRAEPSSSAPLKWNVEPGVVGRLGECRDGWCQLDVDGRAGWVEAARLWGDGEP